MAKREQIVGRGWFRPVTQKTFSIQDFVEQFSETCGRFKTPLSVTDLFEIHLARLLSALRLFRGVSVLSPYAVAPKWQILLNYLYAEDVVLRPEFEMLALLNDMPKNYSVSLLAPKFDSRKTDGNNATHYVGGFGSSSNVEEACSKAVGEHLERYFLTLYKKSSFQQASYSELVKEGFQALDPKLLNTFLPWQKKADPRFVKDDTARFNWTLGKELISGKKAYIPAQLVHWNYRYDPAISEQILQQASTNGAAGHFSFEESVISALYEAAERDAFCIFWLNSIAPPILDVSSCADVSVQELLESVRRYGLELYFLDTTSDLEIPSCVCILIDRRGSSPGLSLGGGAGFDAVKNILSSAREALAVMNISLKYKKLVLPPDYKAFTKTPPIGRNERIALWQGEDMLKKFTFFLAGKRVSLGESRFGACAKTFSTKKHEYQFLLELFKSKGEGYEIYCYEARSPVLVKIGYFVTKIIVPKLFPLYLNEHLATLQSRRLEELPKRLGYINTKMNPWPHPFP